MAKQRIVATAPNTIRVKISRMKWCNTELYLMEVVVVEVEIGG